MHGCSWLLSFVHQRPAVEQAAAQQAVLDARQRHLARPRRLLQRPPRRPRRRAVTSTSLHPACGAIGQEIESSLFAAANSGGGDTAATASPGGSDASTAARTISDGAPARAAAGAESSIATTAAAAAAMA